MADESKQITIIGTGLIGGSIGLALKDARVPGLRVVGHDRDHGAANQAKKRDAIDKAEHNLRRAVSGASLVILATPLLVIRETMAEVAPYLGEGAIVTDTGSTKAAVMEWAEETLPDHVSFVGGHPMAGKETTGVGAARGDLFRGRAYCICPSVSATEGAVKTVVGLAQLLGAEPMFIDPEEHDQYAAAVSHLPLMLSTALFSLLRESPSWDDMGPMASSGFRDATRLASGDPEMSHGIWLTNREAIIHWLDRMSVEIERFRSMLKDAQDDALLEIFVRTQLERDTFVSHPPRREQKQVAGGVDSGKALMTMLVGGMMADTLKKAEKLGDMSREGGGDKGARPSLTDRVAEGVKRDLEALDKERGEVGEREDAGER